MDKVIIYTTKAPAAIGPYSQAIQAGQMVFTSGQLPIDPATGEMPAEIKDQTRQSIENVKSVLEAAGADLKDVVKTVVYIADMDQFADVNSVYSEYFNEDCPARSCIQVARLPKDAGVEIEAIAICSHTK